jgi:hypothetical protein
MTAVAFNAFTSATRSFQLHSLLLLKRVVVAGF